MDRWRNKVAIVTGASFGIGAAIAEYLVKEEVLVVGLARSQDKLKELSKKLNKDKTYFHFYVTDITKEEDILKAFKWTIDTLGPIHILINNAGITRFSGLTDGKTNTWKEILDTNVMGLCIATREAIQNMKENNVDGHIIHINSVAGHSTPAPMNVYGASKYAVTSLTESLRLQLVSEKSKIKVTSISPGYVETNLLTSAFAQSELPDPQMAEEILKMPALQSEDIAESVLYTLSTPPHVQVHELIIKPVGERF
ncbi:hypothetical protein RN001_008766 [Aquatica leii]|uniref:Farnesol dehydrogenase n=1 Tax=Aquatica leii TaxID=1421715 RepID=A0AAN7SRH3_9COLE|nr:hypothetical protein RN001_008766 [Aquatica leii]